MLELARRITLPRLPHPRVLVPLLATVIGAVVVSALLMAGGRRATLSSGRPDGAPVPAPVTRPSLGRCAPGGAPARIADDASGTSVRPSALDRALDATLRAARVELRAPAATAAVVVCGRVEWADASGVLEVGSKRPATNDSLFVLNSAAKTFVAAMVMLESQHGHLALGTRLSRFYPGLPNARQITVRMLLDMTSGLPDYLYNRRIEAMIDHQPRHHWTVEQVLTGLGTPRFAPGRAFQYSDTNYIVLGAILERVTHGSIEHDFRQLIARPLGITSATFVPSPAAKALMAHPYLLQRNGSLVSQWIPGFGVSTAVWGPVFTDGGLAASSLDAAWFANALLGGRLVNARAVTQMTKIGPGDYGFGIRGRSFDGHLWLGHRGYFGGFEAEDWTDPSRQLTIAVATNLEVVGGDPTSTAIWTDLARAYDRRRPGADQSAAG